MPHRPPAQKTSGLCENKDKPSSTFRFGMLIRADCAGQQGAELIAMSECLAMRFLPALRRVEFACDRAQSLLAASNSYSSNSLDRVEVLRLGSRKNGNGKAFACGKAGRKMGASPRDSAATIQRSNLPRNKSCTAPWSSSLELDAPSCAGRKSRQTDSVRISRA
jgi:hypothetical protein